LSGQVCCCASKEKEKEKRVSSGINREGRLLEKKEAGG